MRKQFDLSHIKVDESLQGAHLAAFSRRSTAYALDWLMVFLCTTFLPVTVLTVIIFLVVKNKFQATIAEGNELLNTNLHHLDNRLAEYDIEKELRQRFSKVLSIAIRVAIALIVATPLLIGLGLLAHFLWPSQVGSVSGSLNNDNILSYTFDELYSVVRFLARFMGAVLYFSFFTWRWNGQTPGKRLMGIRVVKLNGEPITLYDSFERVSGYASSASLFLLGFFQFFWDKNHQATHDKLSETIVIDETVKAPMEKQAAGELQEVEQV